MNFRELFHIESGSLTLALDCVHVWCVPVRTIPNDLQQLEFFLQDEERARAGRFYFERDRWRFVTCRGCLRLLASAYLGQAPDSIRFRYGPQGKPALADSASLHKESEKEQGTVDLRFNVSHSGDLVMLAFSSACEIGVDVESMRPDLDFLALAQISFSPVERRAVAMLPPESRAALFYEYWSCKEACIKADGRGVSAGLDQFTVIRCSVKGWREVEVTDAACVSSDMRVRLLDVGAGYAAAVAAPAKGWDAKLIPVGL